MNLPENLRAHALSHYPILHIIAHDDAEVDALIAQIEPERKIIEWNMARGLVRFDTKQPLMAWCDLATALDNLLDQELTSHFIVIRDAQMGLRDQPVAVARLKALTTKILEAQDMEVTIILVAPEQCVPRELEKFITLFEVPLPDEAAIQSIIQEYADAYGVTVDDDILKKLCVAFQGLSGYEMDQLINRGFEPDGMIV